MVKDFFSRKRPWSEYKDLILSYYIDPYVPKVNTLKRPILIVDCFAGPGQFEDGKGGSPLIISSAIRKWRDKGMNIRGLFIEADEAYFPRLQLTLQQYRDFADPRQGTFEQHLPELAALAQRHTIFLYIDPYSVQGLNFSGMQHVYEQIQKAGASVEVLLNFNAATFMRWGLSALKSQGRVIHGEVPTEEDEPYGEDEVGESVELSPLNAIAGGDYWQGTAMKSGLSFIEKVEEFVDSYMALMESSFRWVRCYGVKCKYHHQVPKYYLIYASRSDDGIELMNDAMCRARREFVKDQFPTTGLLFNLTPEEELVELPKVCELLLDVAPQDRPFNRRELRLQAIRRDFCHYSTSDYGQAVTQLLTSGRLFSKNGRSRINDNEPLNSKPFV